MSSVTTAKTLNLYQLGTELGGDHWFRRRGPDGSGQFRLESDADQAALEEAVEAHVADPSVVAPVVLDDEARADQKAETRFVLTQAIPTLRQWANQADAHTVTNGNAVATVQEVVDNLAIFYARFADLLENQYR